MMTEIPKREVLRTAITVLNLTRYLRYVLFVDSDDYLNENVLSILAEYIYIKGD